jgi:spore germination protein KA
MNSNNFFKKLFTYTPHQPYNFNLTENAEIVNSPDIKDLNKTNNPIFSSITATKEYIQTHYNTLINSDIILRDFTLNARGKQYKAILLFIDGMITSISLNDFILEPLMMRNKNNLFDGKQTNIISEVVTNNVTIRKVEKFDLASYLNNCLIPQNSVKTVNTFEDIFSGVNSGNCALFVDTLNIAFDIDVKGFKQRSVDKPENETVIKGPHEAFVENIRTNTSLIRKIVNNENLTFETINIGDITKTGCCVCYIKNLTNEDLIAEVKYRLNNLHIDSLLSSGQLDQLISDSNGLAVPQTLSTERPDKVASYLLDGRIVLLINGNPYALILPATLIDFFYSPDDKNYHPYFANFAKFLRLLAAFITLLLPGLYVAITSFHQEILPTELLFSILASRENVPFPIIFEILIMEISFELIREAGLRVPSPIGSTISIVGGLILGQAAVSAGIVSPILIIIVAITGISSFAIPDYSFGFHLRLYRFLFILLGYIAGFLGISLGLFVYSCYLINVKSFGIPYTVGVSPFEKVRGLSYFIPSIWKRDYRFSYLRSQKQMKQNKKSMQWR